MALIKKISSFFKKERIKGEKFLALDIGTEFVRALIFKIEKDQTGKKEKSVILGLGSKKQRFENIRTELAIDIKGLIITCQEAVREAEALSDLKTDQVIIGTTNQFIKGSTTTLSYLLENPSEPIDFLEMKNIIQKVQWKIFNKIRQELSVETGLAEIEIKLISGTLVDLRLDGYKVINPIGFQGKELSLSIFNTYTSSIYLSVIRQIAKALNLKILAIVNGLYAIAKSVKLEDCIFIDFGDRMTDIALLRRGILEGVKSVNLGGRSFTKRLISDLGLAGKEAEEIKIRYSQGQVSTQAKRKIREILKPDLAIWLKGVEIALSEFSQDRPFPSLILLCGGGSFLPGVKRSLETAPWQVNLPFTKVLKVDFIRAKDILVIDDEAGVLKETKEITPLALANFGLNLRKKQTVCNSILNRVIHLMQI